VSCTPTPQPAESPEAPPEKTTAGEGGKPLAEHHADFMRICLEGVGDAAEYCECGWEQMKETFTLDDMNSERVAPAKLALLRERNLAHCLDKLPEESVQARFTQACVGGRAPLEGYCDCAWTSLKGQLPLADLAGVSGVRGPKIAAAKKVAAKTCEAKMPEEIPKGDFMKGCTRGNSGYEAFCGCAWKVVRSKLSPAEIAAASEEEIAPLQPAIDESCAKLRPAG
jgi:hypothetical protein